jgi:hypothetical protein
MLEGARAMRTYTTTQVAPLLDQERAKVEYGVQDMRQVLDVQIPRLCKKPWGSPWRGNNGFHIPPSTRFTSVGARMICRSSN